MSSKSRGLLFVVSAPSGAGKTTLVERLVEQTPNLKMSRSYTSRAARQGETDGVDYNFVTRERFEAMVAAGEFLEWAQLFGSLYGTSSADTERRLSGARIRVYSMLLVRRSACVLDALSGAWSSWPCSTPARASPERAPEPASSRTTVTTRRRWSRRPTSPS